MLSSIQRVATTLPCTILEVSHFVFPSVPSDASGPSARSSVCELSSGLLSLPLNSSLAGPRVHTSLGIVSFLSGSVCPICLLSTPKVSAQILRFRSSPTCLSRTGFGLPISSSS